MELIVVSDEQIQSLYAWAIAHAERSVRKPAELVEAVRDSATDGLLWARDHYLPSRGEFEPFAKSAIRRCVARTIGQALQRRKNRPTTLQMFGADDDSDNLRMPCEVIASNRPSAGTVPLESTINDLPNELQKAVRLYFVDGYSMRDCALLLGISAETVRMRLHQAARMLAPDGAKKRSRRNGEKRLTSG